MNLAHCLLIAVLSCSLIACAKGEDPATSGAGGMVIGAGGSGGGQTGTCSLGSSDETCNACVQSKCLGECNACASNQSCMDLLNCMQGCSDAACDDNCRGQYPAGEAPLMAFVGATDGCLGAKCDVECGSGCGLTTNNTACDECLGTTCGSQCTTASNDASVTALLDCYGSCASGDTACEASCEQQNPQGASLLTAVNDCLQSQCESACSGSSGCGLTTSDPTCDGCIEAYCFATCAACANSAQCLGLLECINSCASGDTACEDACMNSYPDGVDPLLEFLGQGGCLDTNCATECGG